MSETEPQPEDEVDDEPTPTAGSLEVIVQADVLETTLDALESVTDECLLRFGSGGIDARMVDPANVAMADVDLSASALESVGDGTFPAGVNLDRVQEVLSFADSDQLVWLSFDEETRMLNIQCGRIDREYALVDPQYIRDRPDMAEDLFESLPNTFSVDEQLLNEAVESADLVSDHVAIRGDVDAETIELHAEGDADESTYTFDDDDYEFADVRESCESLLSIDYLQSLLKPVPKDTVVDVTFGEEHPVRLEWSYADGDGDVTQSIAPRIQS